jgi:hypothetical protein
MTRIEEIRSLQQKLKPEVILFWFQHFPGNPLKFEIVFEKQSFGEITQVCRIATSDYSEGFTNIFLGQYNSDKRLAIFIENHEHFKGNIEIAESITELFGDIESIPENLCANAEMYKMTEAIHYTKSLEYATKGFFLEKNIREKIMSKAFGEVIFFPNDHFERETEQLIEKLLSKHNCEYTPDSSWCFGQDLVERIKWPQEANLYITYSELINEFGLVEANAAQANDLYRLGLLSNRYNGKRLK